MHVCNTNILDIAGCVVSSAGWDELRFGGHQWQWQVHYTQTALQVSHSQHLAADVC